MGTAEWRKATFVVAAFGFFTILVSSVEAEGELVEKRVKSLGKIVPGGYARYVSPSGNHLAYGTY